MAGLQGEVYEAYDCLHNNSTDNITISGNTVIVRGFNWSFCTMIGATEPYALSSVTATFDNQ